MTYLPNNLMLSEYTVKRRDHIVMIRVHPHSMIYYLSAVSSNEIVSDCLYQPNMLVVYENNIKARDGMQPQPPPPVPASPQPGPSTAPSPPPLQPSAAANHMMPTLHTAPSPTSSTDGYSYSYYKKMTHDNILFVSRSANKLLLKLLKAAVKQILKYLQTSSIITI